MEQDLSWNHSRPLNHNSSRRRAQLSRDEAASPTFKVKDAVRALSGKAPKGSPSNKKLLTLC